MRISKEAKVGLVAIVALVTLYFGFNYLSGIDFFQDIKRYYVIYNNVGGLNVSNQVTLDGVAVGRVSDIEINQKEQNVLVELEIDGSIIVGGNSEARLHSDLLGTVSVILVIEDLENPKQPGDTIKGVLDKGFEDIIKETTEPLSANLQITLAKINALLDNFEGSGDKIKTTLESLEGALNSIRRTSDMNRQRIALLLDNMNDLVEGLNETQKTIPPMLEKFGTAADSLKAIRINETLVQMESTLKEMENMLGSINSGEGTLGKMVKEDSLYNNINQSLLSLDSLLNHMNTNPKHFFAPLGKSRKKIEKDLKKQQGEQQGG